MEQRTLNRRISKSASDLSEGRCNVAVGDQGVANSRPYDSSCFASKTQSFAASAAHKTCNFLNALKGRLRRGKCRDGKIKKKLREDRGAASKEDNTDYDWSENSGSATQSPQHRGAMDKDEEGDDLLQKTKLNFEATLEANEFQRRQFTALSVFPGVNILPDPPNFLEDIKCQKKESLLRQHSFFQLQVHLKKGVDLIARDKGGTSDPYVKFKVGGRLLYKSKTVYRDLNPVWDETFTIPIEDAFIPVHIKVFDYDWGLQDDFMGSAYLDLTKLDLAKSTELSLELSAAGKKEYLGAIHLTVTLWPKSQEDKDAYFQRAGKVGDVIRRLKSQIWSSVVTIVLVEAKNLQKKNDSEAINYFYVKFRLANEKYKSKVSVKNSNPTWLEQFDFHLYDDQNQILEATVWNKDKSKDDFLGRCLIDLSLIEREHTQSLWQNLGEGKGSIHLLLTISGTTASETISDLATYECNVKEVENLKKRYVSVKLEKALKNSLRNLRDVGHLTVKVYRATGLAAADLGGKSDPFCVLELVNARLQTQTEYKTLSPSWQKIFTFNVKDINSRLEVTVFDEDKDHKVEFLGKVVVPLLRIRNGEKRWYCLKDKKLRSRAKGNCPMILLEMYVVWNPVRACIRSLNPKEHKYMEAKIKFKRQVFVKNVLRLKAIIIILIEWGKFLQDCFEWERPAQSMAFLVLFICLCHYFEPFMIPAALLVGFLKHAIIIWLTSGKASFEKNEDADADVNVEDEEDDEDKYKEEKKSLKDRLLAIQEVTQAVQNAIGRMASLGEKVKNMFNFTVPFISCLAIGLTISAMFVMYFIPLRYLIMAAGVNRFARKVLRPHTIPNNEILDLLSRVPDDEDLIACREFRPFSFVEATKKCSKKKR